MIANNCVDVFFLVFFYAIIVIPLRDVFRTYF